MEFEMAEVNPKIAVEYVDNAAVATLTDKKILEAIDIQALENSIIPLVESKQSINLVLDFSNVEFLSSSALGLLIRVSKKIYESNGQLRLCGIADSIMQIFKITRLDKIFQIYPDRQDALESLGND